MMASVDPNIAPVVAAAPSANKVWKFLHTAYANKSHTRIFASKIDCKIPIRLLKPLQNTCRRFVLALIPYEESDEKVKKIIVLNLEASV